MIKKAGRFAIKLLSLIIFGALSAFVILYAYGYQFDFAKQNVKKTSIIDLSSDLHKVDVLLNGVHQTNALPYQIKNIIPGRHIVQIKKDGFFPWERSLLVKDDVVTLVRDVFLIPENTKKYIRSLSTLPVGYFYLYGNDFILGYKSDSRFLQIVSFENDGSLRERKIEVYREGLKSVRIVSSHYLLASFEDTVFGLININDGGIKFFSLPSEVTKIKFNEDSQTLYFLDDKRLLAAPLASLRLQNEDVIDFKEIATDVDEYVPGFSGQTFFISRGIFFTSDDNKKITHIPDQDVSNFTNLSFKKGQNYGSLIVRGGDGKRLFYGVNSHTQLTLLDNNLKGQPFFNALDQLLYFNANNDLFLYDPKILEKKFIPHSFGNEVSLIGWIVNEGSFVLVTPEGIKIADIFNPQLTLVMETVPDEIFIFNKFFFYLKEKEISVVDWRKDL